MRGDGGVAGEGRVVGVPRFHSWGKCTMPLININSDRMSNTSSGLCIILVVLHYVIVIPWLQGFIVENLPEPKSTARGRGCGF